MWRRSTSTKCGSLRAVHTAIGWQITQSSAPGIQAGGRGQRLRRPSDQDGERARRAAQEQRLGQGPVERDRESGEMIVDFLGHGDDGASGELEEGEEEGAEAANAIERPKMIWMSRRNPPAVSPKASVRPVVMMMITAIDLGDRSLHGIEHLLERLLPRHVGSRGEGRWCPEAGGERRNEIFKLSHEVLLSEGRRG